MKFLEDIPNLEIKETYNNGVWSMQMDDESYSMYSIASLFENEVTYNYCGYSPEALFKSGRDLLAEQLLKDGEPDFSKVKNSIPPLNNGAYMILGAAATWHNLTVGIETGEIFSHTKRIYDLPVPIFSPCMVDINLSRIKPKIFLLGGKFPIIFSVHSDGKDVLEFLYFVEAGDTGKEPVAYIRAKKYKADNPLEYSLSYRIASGSRTTPVRLIAEETFRSAFTNTLIFWSAFNKEGVQCTFPENTLQNVTEGTLMTLAATFTADHAHYGHRIYGEEFHDNFPPNYIWSLEATCLSGKGVWAKRIFRHMMEYVISDSGRFFYRQGEDELYGASAQEYGQLLFVICRYAEILGIEEWSKRDWMKIMRLGNVILSHMKPCKEFNNMRLVKMCAEADTNTRVNVYLNNNLWSIRGLRALGELLTLGGFEEQAKAFKEEADTLLSNIHILTEKYSEESRFGLLPPFRFGYTAKPETLSICDDTFSEMAEEERKAYFVPSFMRDLGAENQDLTENTYANYRYYPEILSSMYLPNEYTEAITKMRENLGGEYMGMVRFMDHLDDWPALHLARYLLETEKVEKYLLLLFAHTCHHGHPDLMCYYEQVLPGVKPVLNDCVPSLLTSPVMSLWMFAYETVEEKQLSLLRAVPKAWFEKGFSLNNIGFSKGNIDISLENNTLCVSFSAPVSAGTEIVWRAKDTLCENDIIKGMEYIDKITKNRIVLKSGITYAEITVRKSDGLQLKNLCEALKIKTLPCYNQAFAPAMAEFEAMGTFIAEDERIYEIIQKYGIFEKWKDTLILAAAQLRKNENLLRFVYLLKHVLKTEGVFDEILEMEFPESDTDELGFNFASLFSILTLLEDMKARYEERGLPQEQFAQSLLEFESKVDDFYRQYKKPGLKMYALWLYKFIHGLILRVGRLNFEIFKGFDAYVTVFENENGEHEILLSGKCFSAEITETDSAYIGIRSNPYDTEKREEVTLLKRDWKPVLKRDDPIVSVHIPTGEKLLPEMCEEAYSEMLSILNTYYPDYKYKIFSCEHSWLMEPHLADFLQESSNILAFQRKYTLYQNDATGKAVYDFLFFEPYSTPIEELPEDTSLRLAVKKHYLNGGRILEQGGLIFETKTNN